MGRLPAKTARRVGARRAVLAVAVALTVLAALPVGAAPAASPTLVGCDRAAVRVQVTTDVVLDPSCTYTAGFDVTASHVTLDCAGALIRSTGTSGIGILVHAPADVELTDVTVTGCRIEGFLNNLRVRRDGFGSLVHGHEYDHPTSDIAITDSDFTGSRGVGLYVDAFVSDVTIADNAFHETGSSGIYLETGSRQNRIERNVLSHNGGIENGTGGEQLQLGGSTVWYWGTGREGISVDGSYDNAIVDNRFTSNSAGGILLYKNCGEDEGSPSWIPRLFPSTGNRIEGNTFTDERTGVWVASRMGENTLPMNCSDPAYVERPGLRVTLDRAPGNTIVGNAFTDVTYGVRVEDDDTTVADNRFTASSPDHHAVIVGTPYRTEALDRPVAGTVLTGNVASITGNDSPYRWVHGQVRTTVTGNSALGRATGICEGEPPPRSLFVMVIAVAPANPDGSKPPTPDLTFPTLGALPSCQRTASTSTTTTTTGAPTADPGDAAPAVPVSGTADYTG